MWNKPLTMKILKITAVLIAGLLAVSAHAQSGKWDETPAGLPYYQYQGPLPYDAEESDPAFLLGNYRLSLKTHLSGIYEIMSGERIWARFNADPERPDYGKNRAVAVIDKQEVDLVGINGITSSPVRYSIETGIGFTRYDYWLDNGIKCSRMISVMPSDEINKGNPCFLVSVSFTNSGKGTKTISYIEAFSPSFVPIGEQMIRAEDRDVKYPVVTEVAFRFLKASFASSPQHFMRFTTPEARSRREVAPQSVFLHADNAFLSINEGELKAVMDDFRLRPGATRTMHIVIGLADEDYKEQAERMVAAAENGKYGAFESMWKKNLPDFSSEKEKDVRREMYWNAHMLESSAVYDSYFKETFVPSGASLTYHEGTKLSNHDHLDAVLPLCYTNPELAKSSLRYVMKHMDHDGRIYEGNEGFGCIPYSSVSDAGLQAHLAATVAEYLRITGDYDFLEERVNIYPVADGDYLKVIEILERCFICNKDMISMLSTDSEKLDAAISVTASYPELLTQMKLSGKASDKFCDAIEKFMTSSQEICRAAEDSFDTSSASFEQQIDLLGASSSSASLKRDIYDYLLDEGIEDDMFDLSKRTLYRFIYGISTFDALDSRSMLRKCSKKQFHDALPGNWSCYSVHPYSWPLYCHFKMSE